MVDGPHRGTSNPWRCLWRLRFGAYAVVVLLVLDGLDGAICEMEPPVAIDGVCASMGPWLSWLAIGVIGLSAVACISQWWGDFSRRERYANQLGGRRRAARPAR
ncbi:MAG: hypothetical protein V4792_20485 [Pseudomonadota bacterium]